VLKRSSLLSVFIGLGSMAAAALPPDPPLEALARAAEAYRTAPGFAERFDYQVFLPGGQIDRKAIEYGRSGDRKFMAMVAGDGTRVFHLTVEGSVLRAVQFNIAGAMVESSYEGSLVAALQAIGADRIGLTVTPGLAASEEGEAVFHDSFGFGVLGAMRPTSVATEDGMSLVTLAGERGTATARLTEAGALVGLDLSLVDGEQKVRLEGIVTAIEVPADDERWTIAAAGLRPVADFASLENAGYPLGSAAPSLEIPTLTGGKVALAEQQGRVVILDFWATWCVPCWSALEHMERLARWAESSGLPVSVWAVDTEEQTTTFEEQAALVAKFLAERGLDVPVAVDFDSSFFAGMHTPGLPSTVLIAPDGTLARFHSGVGDDMEELLKAEVLALLEAQ
jgi:peroxiredoxin